MVYGDGWLVLFGGCLTLAPCGAVSNTLYQFNYATNTWSTMTPTCPPSGCPAGRFDFSMASFPNQNLALLFGGNAGPFAPLGDTWELADLNTGWTWGQPTAIGTPPGPSWGAGMSIDRSDPSDQFVLFGGTGSNGGPVFSGTYTFTGFTSGSVTAGSWSAITTSTTPPGRWGNSMTYFDQGVRPTTGQYVLMFGGIDTSTTPNTVYGDTWYFTGGNWHSLTPASSPPARYDAAMAYSYSDHSVFLYGGLDPTTTPATIYGDGWVWF